MNSLLTPDLLQLETLSIGHPITVNLLPGSPDKQLRTPVAFTDGRGIQTKGHISGINLVIDLGNGQLCLLHPGSVRFAPSAAESHHKAICGPP